MSVPEELAARITDDQECPNDCFFVQRMAKPLGRAVVAGEMDIAGARQSLAETLERHCPEQDRKPLPNGKFLEFPVCSYDYGDLSVGENPFDFIPMPEWVEQMFGEAADGLNDQA
jgi:hypothetical protein